MKTTIQHPLLAFLFIAAVVPGTSHAFSITQVNLRTGDGQSLNQSNPSFSGTPDAATQTYDRTNAEGEPLYIESSAASAEIGVLKARTSITAAPALPLFSDIVDNIFSSQAAASWGDLLIVDGGELNGTLATVTFNLLVSGSVDTHIENPPETIPTGGTSLWTLTTALGGSTSVIQGSENWASGFKIYTGQEIGLVPVSLDVVLGTQALFSVELRTWATLVFDKGAIDTDVYGSVTTDFYNTLVWGGIQSIVLGDGTVVDNWSAIGSSGYDYAPVPIPAAVWLFGSAAAGLAGFTRRRR